MNVLLILGNGFDLNLGLPTAYNHFYQYYLMDIFHTRRGILLRNSMREWKENIGGDTKVVVDWADLELALGKISEKYNSPDDYLTDFEHISEELTQFLLAVQQLPIRSLGKVAERFVDDILKVSLLTDFLDFSGDKDTKNASHNFVGYLDPGPTKGLSSFLYNTTSSKSFLKLDVMTFNYTDIIERIFEEIRQKALLTNKISLGQILHIHQDLGEEGVVLGVDSIEQIKNKAFHSTYSIYNGVVKPNLLKEYAAGIDTQCIDAIIQADVIILFGVSMGATDATWWKQLGQIVKGSNKRIIYCPYERKEEFVYHSRAIINRIHNTVNSFLNKLYLTESQFNDMYSKVYPVRKNQMFNFGVFDDLKIEQEKNLKQVINSLLKK